MWGCYLAFEARKKVVVEYDRDIYSGYEQQLDTRSADTFKSYVYLSIPTGVGYLTSVL